MKISFSNSNLRAQTILELLFVVVVFSFFFGLSMFAFNIFDVAQKQVMLTRTQAMMELGNHSDFTGQEQGKDDPNDQGSQIYFTLGTPSEQTRVSLDSIDTFKKAVEGDMQVISGAAQDGNSYWAKYRFPKFKTNVGTKISWSTGGIQESNDPTFDFDLSTYLAIAHNRSIDLQNKSSDQNVEKGLYSAGIHFLDLGKISDLPADVLEGSLDNTTSVEARLKALVTQDSSLSDEAKSILGKVKAVDGITGGAEAALIQLAISLAYQAAISNLPTPEGISGDLADLSDSLGKLSFGANVAGSIAAAAGTPIPGLNYVGAGLGALGGLTSAFNTLGGGLTLGDDLLGNIASVSNFSSQVLSTANLGFQLAGKNIEGLNIASQVTGVVGGFAGGISGLQNATSNSQVLGSLGNLSGASASAFSLAGQDELAKGFGIAAAGFGVSGSVANFAESYGQGGWITTDANGVQSFQAWDEGGRWAATTSLGEVIQQAGGFVSQIDSGSQIGTAFSLVGGAVGTAGMIGGTGYKLANGKYEHTSDALMDIGAVVASGSAAGTQLAKITGNEKLAEAFAYGSIAGGAIALTGAAMKIGGEIKEGIQEWQANQKEKKEVKAAMETLKSGDTEKIALLDRDIRQKAETKIATDTAKAENKAIADAVKTIDKGNDSKISQLDPELRQKADEYIAKREEAKVAGDLLKDSIPSTDDVVKQLQAQKDEYQSQINEKMKLAADSSTSFDQEEGLLQQASEIQAKIDGLDKQLEQAKYKDLNDAFLTMQQTNQAASSALQLAAIFKQAMGAGAASAIESSGYENFQAQLAAQSNQSIQQVIAQQEKNFSELKTSLQSTMSPVEYDGVRTDMDNVEKMYAELKKTDSNDRDEDAILAGQESLKKLQEYADQTSGVPSSESPSRPQYILERLTLVQNTLKKANEYYRGVQAKDAQVWTYVNLAESQLQDRRIVSSNLSQRQTLRDQGRQVAKQIRLHRERYYPIDNQLSYRLRKAEFSYSRPQFVTAREALYETRDALLKRNRAVQNIRRDIHLWAETQSAKVN